MTPTIQLCYFYRDLVYKIAEILHSSNEWLCCCKSLQLTALEMQFFNFCSSLVQRRLNCVPSVKIATTCGCWRCTKYSIYSSASWRFSLTRVLVNGIFSEFRQKLKKEKIKFLAHVQTWMKQHNKTAWTNKYLLLPEVDKYLLNFFSSSRFCCEPGRQEKPKETLIIVLSPFLLHLFLCERLRLTRVAPSL